MSSPSNTSQPMKVNQADALSRLTDFHYKQPKDTVVAAVYMEPEVSSVSVHSQTTASSCSNGL